MNSRHEIAKSGHDVYSFELYKKEGMMILVKLAALCIGVLMMTVFGAPQTALASSTCEQPDNLHWVQASDHCLALKTFTPSAFETKTLVVVFHGDLSRGGPADYIFPLAEYAAENGAVGVVMMRPGYEGDGRASTGEATRSADRDDRFRSEEIDSIASAVAALKVHYGADRVVLAGHSGGAIVAGVLAGRVASLVDEAVLISCPCHVADWRDMNGWRPLKNAESPHSYLDRVPATTRIQLLTGENDDNTRPRLARSYLESARAVNIQATYVEVPNAGHGFSGLAKQPHVFEALKAAISADPLP